MHYANLLKATALRLESMASYEGDPKTLIHDATAGISQSDRERVVALWDYATTHMPDVASTTHTTMSTQNVATVCQRLAGMVETGSLARHIGTTMAHHVEHVMTTLVWETSPEGTRSASPDIVDLARRAYELRQGNAAAAPSAIEAINTLPGAYTSWDLVVTCREATTAIKSLMEVLHSAVEGGTEQCRDCRGTGYLPCHCSGDGCPTCDGGDPTAWPCSQCDTRGRVPVTTPTTV